MLPFLWQKAISDKIHIYDVIESTNKTAKELAMAGAEHGSVFFANGQTAGKGRNGRTFFSPSGHGIYMSVILHPAQLWFHAAGLSTIFAAVAVCEAIEAVSGKSPQIKWVNDILVSGKKICGILSETVHCAGHLQWIVIGIGINFHTPMASFPEELQGVASSLFAGEDISCTRNCLAAELVNRIVTPKTQYSDKEIIAQYKQRLILGKDVLVTGLGEDYEAVAVDIDERGHLIVQRNNGEMEALCAGEVRIVHTTHGR